MKKFISVMALGAALVVGGNVSAWADSHEMQEMCIANSTSRYRRGIIMKQGGQYVPVLLHSLHAPLRAVS